MRWPLASKRLRLAGEPGARRVSAGQAEHGGGVVRGEAGGVGEGGAGEGLQVGDGAVHGEDGAGEGVACGEVVGEDGSAVGDGDGEAGRGVVAVGHAGGGHGSR